MLTSSLGCTPWAVILIRHINNLRMWSSYLGRHAQSITKDCTSSPGSNDNTNDAVLQIWDKPKLRGQVSVLNISYALQACVCFDYILCFFSLKVCKVLHLIKVSLAIPGQPTYIRYMWDVNIIQLGWVNVEHVGMLHPSNKLEECYHFHDV